MSFANETMAQSIINLGRYIVSFRSCCSAKGIVTKRERKRESEEEKGNVDSVNLW